MPNLHKMKTTKKLSSAANRLMDWQTIENAIVGFRFAASQKPSDLQPSRKQVEHAVEVFTVESEKIIGPLRRWLFVYLVIGGTILLGCMIALIVMQMVNAMLEGTVVTSIAGAAAIFGLFQKILKINSNLAAIPLTVEKYRLALTLATSSDHLTSIVDELLDEMAVMRGMKA